MEAIKLREEAIKVFKLKGQRGNLAWSQNRLGTYQIALSYKRKGKERFTLQNDALENIRSALSKVNREQWGGIQWGLGSALSSIGIERKDVKLVRESLDAYAEAAMGITPLTSKRDSVGLGIAIGEALHNLAILEKDPEIMNWAIEKYKESRKALDGSDNSALLALIEFNIGVAVYAIYIEIGRQHLREGIVEEAIGFLLSSESAYANSGQLHKAWRVRTYIKELEKLNADTPK